MHFVFRISLFNTYIALNSWAFDVTCAFDDQYHNMNYSVQVILRRLTCLLVLYRAVR